MNSRKLVVYILLWAIATPLYSYCQNNFFRHYQVESGLSNNAVMCSIQDRDGFMWFGTRDGINRFDGTQFKMYNFPENNLVHAMAIDLKGKLIVATEKRVYRYEKQYDSFKLLFANTHAFIDEIVCDFKGNIWFNAAETLYVYHPENKTIRHDSHWNSDPISALGVDQNGILWVGTTNGYLKKYDYIKNNFASYALFQRTEKHDFSYINNIAFDHQNILVGTFKGGFKIFDIVKKSYQNIRLGVSNQDLIIRSILKRNADEIWIGTENGIFVYHLKTGKSYHLKKNNSSSNALNDNVIYSLCLDHERGIWVGTYFGGINYLPKDHTPFDKFDRQSDQNPLSGNIVRELAQDKFGNIWVCTEDGGLNKIASRTKKISYYLPNGRRGSISDKATHSLLAVSDELWVGMYEHGLDVLDIKSGKVTKHYDAASNKGLLSNFPFCFYKTKENRIIVGTSNGIYSYNRSKDYFEPLKGFPEHGLYVSILQDSKGVYWGSISGLGLFYFDSRSKKSGNFRYKATDPNSLASDKVNSIFEDSDHNLWFATENGLCKWNSSKSNFSRYDEKHGFQSNFILSILEDQQKRLWISTTRGLVCFQPSTGKITNYTTANGLLSNQFNFSAALKDKDNKLYFGSAAGLIAFKPEQFITDPFFPPVYITGMQINNKEVAGTGSGSPLKNAISFSKSIALNYDQSTVGFDFSALGYTAPQALIYAYKLEGLNDSWTYLKKTKKINFTMLPPGSYLLRIKVTSTSGLWSNRETVLQIKVLPPWWKSRIAIVSYVVVVLAGIYFASRVYHQRIEQKNARTIEKLEMRREKELLQMEIKTEREILESKIDFFTQVAHEIRTPLTLIKIPLGKVIRNTRGIDSITNSLNIIKKNTDRLIELSNQLLDFRQTEIKAFSLQFQQVDLVEFLKDTAANFSLLADQTGVDVVLHIRRDNLIAFIDVDAFTKIIYNLIGNAIKFADRKVIVICTSHDPFSFTIDIKNDGPIIPDEFKDKIFEPFFRLKRNEATPGSGLGLALSSSLVLALNGSLTFRNEDSRLNVFSLKLPLKPIKDEGNDSFG